MRRESRLTFGGVLYIAVTVFLAIGAINSQNNLLFWLFGVAIATVIVSGLISGHALMRTRLRARSLGEAYASEQVRLRYTVTNNSRVFPLFACLISERPDDRLRLMPASVVHIAPGASAGCVGTLVPLRRGRVVLREIRLSTRFPFGLLQKSLVFSQPRPLLVLPHRLTLRNDLLGGVRTQGQEMLRRSRHAGQGVELWGLREYRPGDSRRSIAWKHSAKRNDLVVVEQGESFSTRVWIVIVEPTRPDPDDPAHLHAERAIAIVSSLFERHARSGLPLGLWYPQRGIRFNPRSGRAHAGRVLSELAQVDLRSRPSPPAPAPIRPRDRVVLVQRGRGIASPLTGARLIDTERPGEWLADPSSLPRALGGGA